MVNPFDIRVIKTAQNIQQSFLTLLEQKEFQDITVQDILDQAQINRTTFYKHYPNKNALAQQLVDDFKQKVLLPVLQERFSKPTLEFAQTAAPIMMAVRQQLRPLWKIETPKIHLKQEIYQIVKQRYIQEMPKEMLDENSDLELQAHLYASLLLATMTYALNTDQPLDPVQMLKDTQMMFTRAVL